jgi:hypothetical protein
MLLSQAVMMMATTKNKPIVFPTEMFISNKMFAKVQNFSNKPYN